MSTGAIVAIVAVVVVAIVVAAWALPRMRHSRLERELLARRGAAAEHHREEAEQRQLQARAAEQHAQVQRAEAELHQSRAELHERGLADHELGSNGDMPPATDRGDEQRREADTRDTGAR